MTMFVYSEHSKLAIYGTTYHQKLSWQLAEKTVHE